eukprot:SAG31_NODE_343_length_17426_cov_35.294443_8_plen_64_part_00
MNEPFQASDDVKERMLQKIWARLVQTFAMQLCCFFCKTGRHFLDKLVQSFVRASVLIEIETER